MPLLMALTVSSFFRILFSNALFFAKLSSKTYTVRIDEHVPGQQGGDAVQEEDNLN